jgi:hypothetical protein
VAFKGVTFVENLIKICQIVLDLKCTDRQTDRHTDMTSPIYRGWTKYGNITYPVHISLYGVGPPFAFSTTTVLLGMDSYKFEQSLVEFYAILFEEHLQVALEVLEVGICSSL